MPKSNFLTPSTFPALMSNGRNGKTLGDTALAVVDQLVLDMLGTEPREEMTSAATEWGKEYEWAAIEIYQEKHMVRVNRPEFTVCPDLPYVGGTADGLVGRDLILEIKCPFNPLNHIAREKQLKNYMYQLQGYMWIYNRPMLDFISFDDRFTDDLKLLADRVERDDAAISALKERCELAYGMARERAEQVKKRYRAA